MHPNAAFVASLLLVGVSATPLVERQSCPNIHIFGARETTVPSGYGTAGTFVNLIKGAYPGATSEAIDYPALGGGQYASSVQAGTKNIASQINAFNQKCPGAKLVVVGYSQVRSIACVKTPGLC
jgi:acetylxylan esterase